MEKEPVIFLTMSHKVRDGSESSVDSEGLIDVKIGGERENPGISRSANNDYSKTDTNGTKTILVPDETLSSSFSFDTQSNDFFQARKVNLDESSASESAPKDEQIDVSHESSKSIGGERDNPEISRSDNNGHLLVDTDGIKSMLIPDGASSSSSSPESSPNASLQARKVEFALPSASESASKAEDSDVSHESSKRIGGERKNLEISRSDDKDYLKTYANDIKSILVPGETSSSSSSSEPSSTDFSQTRKANFAEFPASKFVSKDEESDVSRQSFIKPETGNDFPIRASTSPIRGRMSMSPTVAPPVQVMDRSPEYNSYRVPSSVFAVNTNPMDWTNDSDESLFSIQLENPSLARDHFFTVPELHKSVELTKSGELNMFSPQPSVMIEDRVTWRKSLEIEDSQTTETSDKDFKLEGSLDKNKYKVKNSHPALSSTYHGNGIGAQSSALPIEKKQEAPLCCSCPKCSLALCCCWHASPVSPEVENHNYVKTDNSQVTSDSTSNCCNSCRCFSWLCCTSCCSHTDDPHQLPYDKASEKTSSSTSRCCCCFKCCFGSCCSLDNCCCCCCSETDSTRHQSHDKASEETSSSWSWSWSCFSLDNCCCCCSETDSTRHQSPDKASEETSSSWSWSWSCCSSEQNWSEPDSARHQSFNKTSEKTSSSISNCCSWSLRSSGKSCCCCC